MVVWMLKLELLLKSQDQASKLGIRPPTVSSCCLPIEILYSFDHSLVDQVAYY